MQKSGYDKCGFQIFSQKGLTKLFMYVIISVFRKLRGVSSAGRASALQAEGHRFEPYTPHHEKGKSKDLPFSMISVPYGTGDICFAYDIPFGYDIRLRRIEERILFHVATKEQYIIRLSPYIISLCDISLKCKASLSTCLFQ